MFTINFIYQITLITSEFVFFVFFLLNGFKFINFYNQEKNKNITFITNITNKQSILKINCNIANKKCDNNEGNIDCENQKENLTIKKVTYSSDTNFEIKKPIKKSTSYVNIQPDLKNQENIISYSYTYGNLSKMIPHNSPSKSILDELIKNKNNNIMACCNPFCRKKIDKPEFLAFDGYYCTTSCRHFVSENIYEYWKHI